MVNVVLLAAWRACGLSCLVLAVILVLCALAGCNRTKVEDPAVAIDAAQQPGQAVQAAMPGAGAADLLAKPLVAMALAAPPTGAESEWEAKYSFPAAGSIEAGG